MRASFFLDFARDADDLSGLAQDDFLGHLKTRATLRDTPGPSAGARLR
jgi:hypothetical protein